MFQIRTDNSPPRKDRQLLSKRRGRSVRIIVSPFGSIVVGGCRDGWIQVLAAKVKRKAVRTLVAATAHRTRICADGSWLPLPLTAVEKGASSNPRDREARKRKASLF